jgi:hypothetical protein
MAMLYKRGAGAVIKPGDSWWVRDNGAMLNLFSAALDPGADDESSETWLSVQTAGMKSAVQVCRLKPGKDEQCNLATYKFGAADMPIEFSVEASEGAVPVHLCASLETPCDVATLEKLTAKWNASQGVVVKETKKKKAPVKKRKRVREEAEATSGTVIQVYSADMDEIAVVATASQEKRKKRLKLKKKEKEELRKKLEKENEAAEELVAAPLRAKREAAEQQWKAELVDAIKTFGGACEMTVLGSDVKKPKGIPKTIKLAYFMHQHKDTFTVNDGQQQVKKKDKLMTVTLTKPKAQD